MKKVKDFLARFREKRCFEEEEVKERVGAFGPKGPKQKGKKKKK